ncbi:MAG: hypothetical protein OD918_09060 [Gammaproteobacteria bacterium]
MSHTFYFYLTLAIVFGVFFGVFFHSDRRVKKLKKQAGEQIGAQPQH